MKKSVAAARRAFTLIELIITIVIIGILAAIAIVGYSAVTETAQEKADLAAVESADREIRAMLAFGGDVDATAGSLATDLSTAGVTYADVDTSGTVTAGDTLTKGSASLTLSGNATTPGS